MHKKNLILILSLCLICVLFGGCREKGQEAPPLEKEGYVLDFYDEFDGDELDFTKWLPQYLPHATTSLSGFMADYDVSDGSLKLQIDEDRPTFYEQENPKGFKVCGIQSYNKNSLHERTAIGANVVPYEGYTTQYGYFEIRYKMPAGGGGGHVAFWLIGTQADAREDGSGSLQTGEIDITETRFDAPNVHAPKVYNWTDEDLQDWMVQIPMEEDYVNEYHVYAMDWTPEYLAFYVDGVEIARTEQSPQYEMCMILSMYINDDPDSTYWSGVPSDVFPKVWEIDYVRVYKKAEGYPNGVTKPTDPVVLPGEEGATPIKSELVRDPSAPNTYFDVASAATLTYSDEPALNSRPEAINSTNPVCGDGYASTSEPNFPQEFTFMWDSPQTVDTMKLFVHFALGQAPNIVEIQTLKEGGQWEKAANFTIKWKTEMEAIECATMEFPNGEDIIGLKLIVHNANLRWNMYVINKIHIYNSKEQMPEITEIQSQIMTEEPKVGNLAPFATLTYSHGHTEGSRPETVNDANVPGVDGFASIAGDPLPQELTFTWKTAQNVDTVDMYVNYALGQAPTYVELQTRKSGGQWESKGLYHITWLEESEKLEFARLPVTDSNGIIALKLIVRAANMSWGNFVINKVQIYKEGVAAPDPNAPIGTPTSNFVGAPEGMKNVAPLATITISDAMVKAAKPDDAASNPGRINDGLINDDSYARYANGTECKDDWIRYTWDNPVTVDRVVLFNQYSGQAPKAWSVYVTKDGTNWNRVCYTGNVQWAEESKEGKVLKFQKQEGIIGLRVDITDANVGWGHYTIYELEVYGTVDKDPEEAKIPVISVTDFVEAPEGLENLAPQASISISQAMANVAKPDDGSSDYYRINDGLVNEHSYARYADGTQCKDDYIEFRWEKSVSVEQLAVFNQYSGQAPTGWTVYVTTDGETWQGVALTENVTWSAEQLEGKLLAFQKQDDVLGVRLEITSANVEWGHYTVYEVEIFGTPSQGEGPDITEPEETKPVTPVTDFVEAPEGVENLAPQASISISQAMANVAKPDDGSSDYYRINDGLVNEHSYARYADGTQCKDDYIEFRWEKPVSVEQLAVFNQYCGQAPTGWTVYVTTDGETWQGVALTENVTWSAEQLEGKLLAFQKQDDVLGVRLEITSANVEWGHYTIYEVEIFGTPSQGEEPDITEPDDTEPEETKPVTPVTDFVEAPEGLENLAPQANISISQAMANVAKPDDGSSDYYRINDGLVNEHSYARYADGTQCKDDYIEFRWEKPVSVEQLAVFNQYCGQAPTGWTVYVTTDGETWQGVALTENVTWSAEQLEGKLLAFQKQDDILGVRLEITSANVEWGHYTVYEVEIFGTPAEPEEPEITEPDVTEPEVTEPDATEPEETTPETPVTDFVEAPEGTQNVALNATASAEVNVALGNSIAQLNEGDRTWSLSRPATTLEGQTDYYYLTWDQPVNVQQVVLFNQYSGQAPTAWKIAVTTDGETWNEIGDAQNVTWSENDLQGKALTFAEQKNIIGLCLQIVDANLDWGHYCIYELEVYGAEVQEPDVPEEPEEPVFGDFTAAPEGTQNVALNATASAEVNEVLGNSIAQLNEGDRTWSLSRPATTLEGQTDYYYLTWDQPVNIQQVVLFNQYSGQAPTAWKIAVTTDGETWNEIGGAQNVTWSENDLEGKALTFAEQKNVIGLRVQIVDASLIWGHYTIYELEVYGNPAGAAQNLALNATVTASEDVVAAGTDFSPINIGDRTWSMGRTVSSMEGVNDYYQFNWAAPVSVSQVVLYNQYRGQAPTAWKIFVTTDGETWNEVASIADVQWSEDQLEGKEVTFAEQKNIIGLRVQIVDANLDWGHYCIYEIEIY